MSYSYLSNSETKHTPAPWKISEALSDKHRIAIVNTGSSQHLIAEVVRYGSADAKIIAAAPEMLESIKELLSWAESVEGKVVKKGITKIGDTIFDEARKLITKAETI